MFEYLSAYLEAYATPAQKQLYLDACQTLVDHGVTAHVFAIDQDLAVAESLDSDIVFSSMNEILIPLYIEKLGEMGLVVDHEAPIHLLTDTLRGLLLVENYEDKETLSSMLDCDEGKEAAIADILAAMGQYQSAEYLPIIQDVSDELIARMREVVKSEPTDDQIDHQQVAAIRHRVERFLNLPDIQGHLPILAFSLVRDGLKLGIPHEDLLEGRQEYLDSLKSPEKIAINLLAFILISATVEDDLLRDFSMELELLHIDPLVRTQAHVLASKLIKALLNG